MPTTDPRVDAYIAKSADFAQPILNHLREVIHAACPEVKETIKWSMPNFDYHGIMCNFAAFKQHCAFGFWKAELLLAAEDDKGKEAMGQFGRITSIKDLPPKKVLTAYVRKAMKLNEAGVKVARPKTAPRELLVPDYFIAALEANPAAYDVFKEFSASAKRDYCDWLTEAKTAATRDKRMAQAVEWIAEGKKRNWKYENC
ncbi:YdeI/OmpD-associated family protein [Pseudoduganella violaceinigra]|uniref:YdeI/OmpD-associated family protein n=1 Tax=Pseudoduganella violaceinigra TaxID=246602 RepID=UPI0004110A99|nr:YdeI/OmpD-associated family protein [Pseudoduganella violaceinigra]